RHDVDVVFVHRGSICRAPRLQEVAIGTQRAPDSSPRSSNIGPHAEGALHDSVCNRLRMTLLNCHLGLLIGRRRCLEAPDSSPRSWTVGRMRKVLSTIPFATGSE